MGGHSGGGGKEGRGGAGQPGEVIRAANEVKLYTPENMSGRSQVTGAVDLTKPVKVTVSGRTYDYRTTLKEKGFTFRPGDNTWTKTVNGEREIVQAHKDVSRRPRAERLMQMHIENV